MPAKRISLSCKISRGGFSGERVILVSLVDGTYRGIAPTHLCWNENQQPLEPNEPAEDETIDGFVAAYLVKRNEEEKQAIVSVPDGSVFVVPLHMTSDRPKTPSDVLV